MIKNIIILLLAMIIFFLLLNPNLKGLFARDDNSRASAKTNNLTNPLKDNCNAEEGAKLWQKNCYPCHGVNGDGRGPANLTGFANMNLLDPALQKLNDQDLYNQISNGKSPMPAFQNTLNERDRWQLVCYVRELGRNSKNKK